MPSPLLGYNTNVRHHGKLFHIQTEDSGVQHAHIFTHLFADGGRIIATKKSSYAHWIGTDRYPGVVKKLMQAQHKAMFIALRDGLFDKNEVEGAKVFASREIALDDDTGEDAPAASEEIPIDVELEVDVDALERAAQKYSGSNTGATPPKGASSPGMRAIDPKATGEPARRARLDPTPVAGVKHVIQAPRPVVPKPGAPKPSATAASQGRYQPTQPASARPRAASNQSNPKPADSVFGADILTEKSLDEVIMSYLAEDLDDKE
jgi:hypothetical protein